jgi:ferritin
MTPKMIISQESKDMLDDAIHSELYASNLYKHIANELQRLGYFGTSKFFLKESADELAHYQVHVEFQNDVGTVAKVPAIESMLYNDYKKWYGQASDDPVVQQFLLQFLEIQRTSVGEYGDLLSRIQLVDGDKAGMLLIDQELGG